MFQGLYVFNKTKQSIDMIKTTIKIDGMMCSMCEAHINDVIRKNFDIRKVRSSHRKNQTVIESNVELDQNRLKEVVDSTGYKVIEITTE